MTEVKAATAAPPISTGSTTPTPPVAPAATAVAPAVAPPPPQDAPAVSLAGSLSGLNDGTRLEGLVIGEDGSGQPILRTAAGSFVLDVDQDLQQDTRLLLQLLSTSAGLRAVLLTIDGAPQQPPPVIGLTSIRPDSAAPQAEAEAAAIETPLEDAILPPLAPQTRLLATVLPQPAPGNVGQGSPLPAGTQLTLLVLNVPTATATHPQSGPSAAPHAAAGAVPDPAPGAPSVPATAVVAPPRASLPGQRIDRIYRAAAALEQVYLPTAGGAPATRPRPLDSPVPATGRPAAPNAAEAAVTAGVAIGNVTAKAATAPAAASTPFTPPTGFAATPTAAAGGRLIATVVGAPAAGRVLLQTPIGFLSAEIASPPPPGSRISLEILDLQLPKGAPAPDLDAGGDPLLRLSRDWSNLREAIEVLRTADPPTLQHLLDNVIPRPTQNLGSGLLLFVAALRGGNIGQWLGRDASEKLQHSGRSDLLHRLDEDFSQIGRLSQQSGHGDWKALMLPFYDGQAITQIKLFSRRHRNHGDDGDGNEGGDRFVVELNLSSLGAVQMDGLYRAKQLALILRTQETLTQQMRREITAIFEDATARSGIKGTLAIQVTRRFPVAPLDEMREHRAGNRLFV